MKTALVLGIGGQDGSYLADILLARGYAVHGAYRRSSGDNLRRIAHCRDRVRLHLFDLADGGSIARLLHDVSPDIVFNAADQDHVGTSFDTPEYSFDVTAGATVRLLEAVRLFDKEDRRCNKKTRVFLPTSATIFGNAPAPQNEQSPTDPQSPYAICKLAVLNLARLYRRKYGMFVSTGIFYGHDSPRRGPGYLLGSLVRQALDVKYGRAKVISVGDAHAVVDLGCAREYMDAAWRLMQLDEPDDFVIATGKEMLVGDIIWEILRQLKVERSGVLQTGTNANQNGVRLIGDASKAARAFGFAPTRGVAELVADIVAEYEKEYKQCTM